MSKYSSICTAINLIEVVAKMMKKNGGGEGNTEKILNDLREIAKDVRYGGEWEGDYEVIASALNACQVSGEKCGICPYHKIRTGCTYTLKNDAAAAIRQMGKDIEKLKAQLAEAHRELSGFDEEKRQANRWDVQESKMPIVEEDRFPWDGDEEE